MPSGFRAAVRSCQHSMATRRCTGAGLVRAQARRARRAGTVSAQITGSVLVPFTAFRELPSLYFNDLRVTLIVYTERVRGSKPLPPTIFLV